MLKKIVDSFKKAWRGEEKLSVVFWGWVGGVQLLWVIFCVLISSLISKGYTGVTRLQRINIYSPDLIIPVTDTVPFVVAGIVLISSCVLIWRCSFNSNNRFWGYFLRIGFLIYLIVMIGMFILQKSFFEYLQKSFVAESFFLSIFSF
jgi:hypothetical protein